MAQKIFQKFGVIREQNLSDIEDLTVSLNNLLDKLVEDAVNDSFISEDLDCIRSISTTGITNEGFLVFANNEETLLSPVTQTLEAFRPSKTYQNRLDIIRVFSGEPRLSGGNGLTAKYYNANQIKNDLINGDAGDVPLFSGSPVATETGVDQNTTWTNGRFDYNGKISDAMSGFGGGVQWEGFFIPTFTGSHEFEALQTGLFHMDFQAEGTPEGTGGYTTAKRIGAENSVTVIKQDSGSANNVVRLKNLSDQKFVGLGLTVSGTSINSTDPDGGNIGAFDQATGDIALSGATVTGSVGDEFSLTMRKKLGELGFVRWDSPILEKFRRYKIKFRFFFPTSLENQNVNRVDKFLEFDFTEPLSSQSNLRYTRLYTTDYDFSEEAKGRVFNFRDSSVLFGGGEVGENTNNANGYVTVKTDKKVDIKYVPKKILGTGTDLINGITRRILTVDIVSGSKLVLLSDTTGIEIGNKVFGTNVPAGAEVIEVIINEGMFISTPFTATNSGEILTLINHRGFVKRVTGTCSGTTLSITSGNTDDLKDGMIVIGNDGTNGDFSNYTKITTSSSTTQLQLSSSKTMTSTFFYFYQSKGLLNDSLVDFCLTSGSLQTRCLITTQQADIDDTEIFVEGGSNFDAVGNTGWDAQGSAFDGGSSDIVGKNTSGGTFSIVINEGLVRPISSGANFTTTNNSDSRILCCPPTDTSPPFQAVETGLRTTSSDPKLVLDKGNLVFDNLSATTDAGNVSSANASSTVDRSILIETGVTAGDPTKTENQGTTFKILCD